MSSKLREALSDACYAMFNFLKTQNGGYEEMANALDKAKAALAEPLRNCDVGTAEEQEERYLKLKREYVDRVLRCPAIGASFFPDSLYWAQLPYEETRSDEAS